MFTGIIDHCGVIKEIKTLEKSSRVFIESQFNDLQEGESIAVDGICLTVVQPQGNTFYCDISNETLRLTTAANFHIHQKINLERALRLSDRLGGHWVTGHVDQTAQVNKISRRQEFIELDIQLSSPADQIYLFKKGSIAVNGVSLTINELTPEGFQLMLIPHTLARTNLDDLKKDDQVNLEFDAMVKIIIEMSNRRFE